MKSTVPSWLYSPPTLLSRNTTPSPLVLIRRHSSSPPRYIINILWLKMHTNNIGGQLVIIYLTKWKISLTICPSSFIKLKEISFTKCGFDPIFNLIGQLSPHIGDNLINLQTYVNTLKIHDGESVLPYYLCTVTISEIIFPQKDSTGQNNRLIYRFTASLFQ